MASHVSLLLGYDTGQYNHVLWHVNVNLVLLISDFTSRHDLLPWYACHYVEAEYRGKALGKLLLDQGIKLAAEAGFEYVYLSTDHDGYYEKYGWERIDDAFEPTGAKTRIYRYSISVP